MIELGVITPQEIGEKLSRNGKFYITFVGDSLTSCEWIHPNWREIVEYALKEELQKNSSDWRIPSWGVRCFNYGFDGATTKDVAWKLEEIMNPRPDLVIGLMGGNDPILGLKTEETRENLKKILEKFKNNSIEVAWGNGLPDLRNEKNKLNEPYRKVAMEFEKSLDIYTWYEQWNLEHFYTFRSEENIDEGIKEGEIDPTHPNQLGNAYIAKFYLKEVFGIDFYPEKFIEGTLSGEKFPRY